MALEKPLIRVLKIDGSGRWRLELSGLQELQDELGVENVIGFCRCFVHSDRLISLLNLAYLSRERYGASSVAFKRDLQTIVWFVVGTLWELTEAIQKLRKGLHSLELWDHHKDPWKALNVFERRWSRNKLCVKLRNKVAFHVDPDVIKIGLQNLATQSAITVAEGDGEKNNESSFPLGLEALFRGMDLTISDYEDFMKSVGEDQSIFTHIHNAFFSALEAKNVCIETSDGDA